MILFRFCRVVIICLFMHGLSVFSYQSGDVSIHITNTLTDVKDSISMCKKNNDELQCHELKTNIELSNPIATAIVEKKLFIANYGVIKQMGTSFLLRCDLPDFGAEEITCEGILGLATQAHITGLAVVSNQLLFVRSNTNITYNELIICPLPIEGRVSICNQQIPLVPIIYDFGYNTFMPITVSDGVMSIFDDVGRRIFECTLPQEGQQISCQEHLLTDTPFKNINALRESD